MTDKNDPKHAFIMTELSVEEAIFTTRSMRHLKPDPIPKADLEFIIEAATMAPSAGNYQMWAFVVVTDEQTKQGIGNAYREAGTAYIKDTVLANPDTDDERRRVYTQAMHTVEHLAEAPVIIVACLTQPCPDDAATGSGLFGSIYPAAQNLMLAARSRGLGSVLLTLATDYSPTLPHSVKPVKEILDLPEDVGSVALIPVGYPKGQWGRPRREDVANSLHWEKW